jgi:hypothetical protein
MSGASRCLGSWRYFSFRRFLPCPPPVKSRTACGVPERPDVSWRPNTGSSAIHARAPVCTTAAQCDRLMRSGGPRDSGTLTGQHPSNAFPLSPPPLRARIRDRRAGRLRPLREEQRGLRQPLRLLGPRDRLRALPRRAVPDGGRRVLPGRRLRRDRRRGRGVRANARQPLRRCPRICDRAARSARVLPHAALRGRVRDRTGNVVDLLRGDQVRLRSGLLLPASISPVSCEPLPVLPGRRPGQPVLCALDLAEPRHCLLVSGRLVFPDERRLLVLSRRRLRSHGGQPLRGDHLLRDRAELPLRLDLVLGARGAPGRSLRRQHDPMSRGFAPDGAMLTSLMSGTETAVRRAGAGCRSRFWRRRR